MSDTTGYGNRNLCTEAVGDHRTEYERWIYQSGGGNSEDQGCGCGLQYGAGDRPVPGGGAKRREDHRLPGAGPDFLYLRRSVPAEQPAEEGEGCAEEDRQAERGDQGADICRPSSGGGRQALQCGCRAVGRGTARLCPEGQYPQLQRILREKTFYRRSGACQGDPV